MHPTDKAARVAGAVYLSMVFTAPFSLIYVPRTLIVRGDATATANNILTHETLFRLGIVADLIPAPNEAVVPGLVPVTANLTLKSRKGIVAVRAISAANEITTQILK